MKRLILWSAPIIALVAVAVLLMQPNEAQSNIIEDLISGPEGKAESGIIIGHPEAPVTIEEYASLSCPHCAKFHNEILPELMEPYIKSGKARLVWHSYVRNEPDLKGTMLLQCLGDNARQASFVKVLFNMQDRWAFEEDFLAALGSIARAGGMSEAQFNTCMADTELEIAVLGARHSMDDSGKIKSTPTFYIEGQQVLGSRPAEEFGRLIEEKLHAIQNAPSLAPEKKK